MRGRELGDTGREGGYTKGTSRPSTVLAAYTTRGSVATRRSPRNSALSLASRGDDSPLDAAVVSATGPEVIGDPARGITGPGLGMGGDFARTPRPLP